MVNGFRMDDAQSGHHDMDLPLPTESLERIEVLRGAGSTLYGSDAIGGAVNFITGPPAHSELRAGAGIGNFGINQQNVSGSLVAKRWDEQLSVDRDFSTGFMPDRDYRSLSIFSTTGATSALGNSDVMLAYADKPYGANQFYGNFNSWERTKGWFAALKQDLGTKTEVDLGYRRHTDEFVLFRDKPQIYENNHVTESWQVALRRRETLGRNASLFYGGEGDHDAIDSNNLGRHTRSRGAGYVDVDFRALGRFSLSAGAREEIFDYSGGAQFSPTVAAGFWIKSGWKLKASASRAFRLPTYTDLYYHDPANAGNPNLKPESAWSYEGGLDWNPGGRFKAEATVFEQREHNVIDYVQFMPSTVFQAANIQNLNFTGVETSFHVRLTDVQRLVFSYTGLRGAQQALNGLVSRYVFNYPINNAVVGWQGQLPGKILARTRVGATERFARDPYAVWDADVARQFGNVGARLSFSNLTNTSYQEVEGVAMPGRSVVFGVEYVLTSGKKY
jgi:iron complex outermembrane receptor protein